jgi:hypothetical protein
VSDPIVVVAEETPPSEPAAPLVETATSAAVEIARIEADRDVSITDRQAGAAEAIAATDAENDEDVAWLRNELDGLRARLAIVEGASSSAEVSRLELSNRLDSLTETQAALALLIPPPPSQPATVETVETSPSDAPEGALVAAEPETVLPARPEPEPPRKRQRRWL